MTRESTPLKKWQLIAVGAVGVVIAAIVTGGVISEQNAPTTPTAATPAATEDPESAASEPDAESETVAPEPEEVLTVENSEDLAALLAAVEDYDLYAEFAAEHKGSIIEFDGVVAAINLHGEYNTRYDILIFAGNSIGTAVTGPNFQFNDVNLTYDLHFTGSEIPDALTVGQKLRITAEVDSYDGGFSDLLLLDPVSTEARQ